MRKTVPNGTYIPAIGRAVRAGVDITAKWMVDNCGMTRRQADNALTYARRLGLLRRTVRGHHLPATAGG